MPAGTTPIFPATPKSWYGQVSAANTNRDGTGTLVTLVTGVANGTRIDRIRIRAAVTTTAGMVRFYISLDGGTTKRLWKEVIVSAITVGAATEAFNSEFVTPDLYLPDASAVLYASTHNAEAINIVVGGADY